MPLVSVIVPVFNGEKTIRETIESVLNQTLTDLELIVINDGSQDSTLSIVSSIQDPRLKVFSYENAGVANSRNRGFSHASGEFVSFLDADDLWTPEKLEEQVKALQANPQAAVAYSWVDHIDQSGEFLRLGNRITITGDLYENLLVRNTLQNGSNPLIRRQAFAEVGGFKQKFFPAEDWDMWLRLAAQYQFVAVPLPQILYRISPDSMSSKVEKMKTVCLQIIEEAFDQAPESLQHLKKKSLSGLYSYLSFKTLEAASTRRDGLTAAQLLWRAIAYDKAILLRGKMMLSVLFKIAAVTVLSPDKSQDFIMTTKQLLMR